MAELEKVIKGLECCQRPVCPIGKKCPYSETTTSEGTCRHWLEKDAIELLKEQQKQIEEAYDKGFTDGQNNILEAQAEGR